MAKNVNTATAIKVQQRPELPYMGIRFIAPFAGMFQQVALVQKELERWFAGQGVKPEGPPLLRYHVVDMKGAMDLEYGIQVAKILPGDDRVKPAALPAGRYASLIYSGGGYQGNKALIEGAHAQGLEFDQWVTDSGDAFQCRYEAFLTDPKVEPRKTRWDIEVAIRLRDE